ncbi:PREDICTED: branched-chain-amino-acid aminotransferase 5, chloroplastic-like isoform X2 [Ipomoea nil]|uniref:branched-chain-amino-acid aminotransferase 5, chloroplastic-like isoform X2 n=1 Tax=Ipomoea nil TaxID=35883 RepID=UPI000901DB6C|nr:PREDICTED: branched-chain-amino-acid aminotransferase 5, chloroplastic-like isoform X2 [Ipomoea nil]
METGAVFAGLQPTPTHLLRSSPTAIKLFHPSFNGRRQYCPLPLKLQKQSRLLASYRNDSSDYNGGTNLRVDSHASNATLELADIDWDDLGFSHLPTDYMYIMKCSQGDSFSKGELLRFGNIELNPSAGILNYGQGVFEGLKAYRKGDGKILLFQPKENALRLKIGAERMCMPSPTVEQFMEAVKLTVLANERWIPPPGKGSLYIRPLLMGSGPVLGLAPAPEYTFLIYVSPVGNYFKVLKAQSAAKAKGYSDVLYLDSVHNKYLEEVSSCNIFVVKGNTIATPALKGTILPGITRKSIIDVASSLGFQVEERSVTVEELFEADEVFCTGTAVVVSPVGSITYLGKRIAYGSNGVGIVSQQLYSALTSLQMGVTEDKMGWIVELK